MTNYANEFYTMSDKAMETIKVLWAWAITLMPIAFVGSIAYLMIRMAYDTIKETYKEHKNEKKTKPRA